MTDRSPIELAFPGSVLHRAEFHAGDASLAMDLTVADHEGVRAAVSGAAAIALLTALEAGCCDRDRHGFVARAWRSLRFMMAEEQSWGCGGRWTRWALLMDGSTHASMAHAVDWGQ